MKTNKSALEIEAEKCKSVPTARENAEEILVQTNGNLRSWSLVYTLEALKPEQDISRRNLSIYVCRMAGGMSSKEVAKKYGLKANNVDQIVWRVGRLVRKHGPRHFAAALRREGYGCAG